jgi:hypothetical protein
VDEGVGVATTVIKGIPTRRKSKEMRDEQRGSEKKKKDYH